MAPEGRGFLFSVKHNQNSVDFKAGCVQTDEMLTEKVAYLWKIWNLLWYVRRLSHKQLEVSKYHGYPISFDTVEPLP
jgi:hypothetical protein